VPFHPYVSLNLERIAELRSPWPPILNGKAATNLKSSVMAGKKKDKTRTPRTRGTTPKPRAAKKHEPPELSPGDEGPAAPEEKTSAFPVVGIGASAGGLDAFKKLFSAMPNDSGAAFALIPHLDPKHESLMAELLSRYTR